MCGTLVSSELTTSVGRCLCLWQGGQRRPQRCSVGIRTLLGKSEGELSGWEHLRKTGQAWVGTSPVWEVGLLGAPGTIMAGYCPRVLGGMTMPGAFRPSLDASRGGSRIVLAMTGPIREHNQGAGILATETVEDEREVIWSVSMAQQRPCS